MESVFDTFQVVLAVAATCALAQYAEERAPRYIASETKAATTPVPILKQINRHNEDGSYTYGYEAADGSFKIETKSPAGEVKGKYGYKDNTGKLRVIEYGANKYGFQPAGEGITVAPPTLVDESTREPKTQGGRGQYNSPDYDYEEPAPAPAPRPRPAPQPRPQPQPQYRPAPQQQQQYRPAPPPPPQPQQQYRPPPQPQQQYRPQPQPQPRPPPPQHSAPAPPKPQFFAGAAPSPIDDNFFNPEPAPRQYKPKQDFRPAPQIQEFGSDDFAPAPQRYQPNQVPQQRNTQTYSMLDQLLKEYSLPQGGAAPLHDISFGSY
ncbi:hypothetical protein O3G_MSEX007382 [Manduca sexta]|uniref:Cuticle protein n=1 Tax=Manduca sexta TaxID=7130 RepID=A0A921Z822_MANSE|nr:hypothetical protein O3G_MSEX007382 [Manduca sexta]